MSYLTSWKFDKVEYILQFNLMLQHKRGLYMSPKGIRLFFTNLPLVSVSQHNANSIAIFRHYIYFHHYNSPAFLSLSLHFVDRQSSRAQPISCFDDPI